MADQDPQTFLTPRKVERVIVDEPPKLDLDAYIANYKGRTRFERLYLIGRSSTYLSTDALKAAVAEAKQGKDVLNYERATSALREIAPGDPDAALNQAWVDKVKKQVKMETDKMEAELKGYKNNLIKESIRMGYDDLGQHYHMVGDLSKSNKAYSTMRDYCTTNSHIVIMNMHLINVNIDQRSWFAAQNHIQRIRGSTGGQKFPEADRNSAKLYAAHGLTSMVQGNYKDAAEEFLTTNPRMSTAKLDDPLDEESYNEVLTPNDVAVYGGLCALATMTREELKSKVLDNNDFRNYLELEPHIRRAVSYFVAGDYSRCLSILDSYKADYLLDLYLQSHLAVIYYEIRSKAIRQYFISFSVVTLANLAAKFNTDESGIEGEVTQLIKRNELKARLDLVDRVVLAKKVDARSKVIGDALEAAKEYEKTAHLRILRMAMLNAGLEVRGPKDKGGGIGLGTGASGGGDLMGMESQGRGTRSGGLY